MRLQFPEQALCGVHTGAATFARQFLSRQLCKQGASYSAIARKLCFAVSSVYYEIQRGLCEQRDGKTWKTYEAYSAAVAQNDAD